MRRSILALVAAATLGLSSAAHATDATGTIKTVAPGMLSLATGERFKIPPTVKTRGFKVGARVTVSYTMVGKIRMATAIRDVR